MTEVKRAGFAILLLLAAANASAQRGEICRFRALDPENPVRRWLGSQEVTCARIGMEQLTFPPGLWNVFVRSDYDISVVPQVVDGDAAQAWPVRTELVRAAWMTPMLPAGHTGVVYIPRHGSAMPVDRARMTVPAGEPLWLFVLDKGAPVAVVTIPPLAPETEQAVDARRGEGPAIVGWLHVPEMDRDILAKADGVFSPFIRAGTHAADPLPPPANLHGAFFLIRDVPAGNSELRVTGRGWVGERQLVKVQPGVTIAAAPLTVRVAGTLMLRWSTDQDLPALDRSVGSCDAPAMPARPVIALLKCGGVRGQRPGTECALVREETVADVFGSLTFDDVEPGLYRAELRFGKLAPVSEMRNVNALEITDLRLKAEYVTLHGSVTRGGEPLGEDVRIRFPTGIGFAPADSDQYHAVLLPPRGGAGADVEVTVAPCESEPAVVLTDRPIRPGARLDLDIPVNELAVHVSDTFTTEPLPDAQVKLEVMAITRAPRVVSEKHETSDGKGNVVWTGLPVREMHLTITLAGYEKQRIAAFTMPARGDHAVDVQLVPLRGARGKIVSDRRFDHAQIVWFSPTGSETERADIAPDGTFVFQNWHSPDETMAVVSASHPLWVQRTPGTARRETITVRFPAGPVVAFGVGLSPWVPTSVTRYIGIEIGGVRVPQPVLAQHQTLRRGEPFMRGSGQHFRDILATGPIEVLLGPMLEEVAVAARNLDIFALPKFAAVPRERLEPGSTHVMFSWR